MKKLFTSFYLFMFNMFLMCGLIYSQDSSWTIFNSSNSPLSSPKKQVKQDSDGIYWIGTYSGLFRFDGENWEVFNKDNSDLPSDFIEDFDFDSEGNIWIANYRHLVKFNYAVQNMLLIPIYDSLGYEAISIAVDADGVKWFGNNYELIRFDDSTFTSILIDYEVSRIFFDGAKLWIGAKHYFYGYGKVYIYTNNQLNDITEELGFINTNFEVYQIKKDYLSRVWISTSEGIAYLFDNEWNHYDRSDWMTQFASPRGIAFDSFNNLCIGVQEGNLFVKKPDYWEIITRNNSEFKPTGQIWDINNDNQNKIWISTNEELIVFNGNLTEIETNNSHWRASGWGITDMNVSTIDTQYTKSRLDTSTSTHGKISQLFSSRGTGLYDSFQSVYTFELPWGKRFDNREIPVRIKLDYKILSLSSFVTAAQFLIGFGDETGTVGGAGAIIDINSNEWQTSTSFDIQNVGKYEFIRISFLLKSLTPDTIDFNILLDNFRFVYPWYTLLVESFGDSILVDLDGNQLVTPYSYKLNQNYPNPFNPSTKISWQSPIGSWQTLKVYDILGNELATLVDEYRQAGSYEIEFNPASSIKDLASGIYFYRLRAGSFVETKKMILIK